MSQEIYEVIVHGAHSAGMAKFLTDRGALMLRIDPTNKYVLYTILCLKMLWLSCRLRFARAFILLTRR